MAFGKKTYRKKAEKEAPTKGSVKKRKFAQPDTAPKGGAPDVAAAAISAPVAPPTAPVLAPAGPMPAAPPTYQPPAYTPAPPGQQSGYPTQQGGRPSFQRPRTFTPQPGGYPAQGGGRPSYGGPQGGQGGGQPQSGPEFEYITTLYGAKSGKSFNSFVRPEAAAMLLSVQEGDVIGVSYSQGGQLNLWIRRCSTGGCTRQ